MTRFMIAAYPRSGSLVLRSLLDFSLEHASAEAVSVRIRDFRDMIGLKERGLPVADGLVLITRDPVEAISALVLDSPRRQLEVSEKDLRRVIDLQVSRYLETAVLYASVRTSKIHVLYEGLCAEDGWHYACSMLEKLGGSRLPSREDFARMCGGTKSAQKTSTSKGSDLVEQIIKLVGQKISYPEVMAYL